MTAADLAARVYYLETRLTQTDAALRHERNRVAILQDTCDAWARAFGAETARRKAAQRVEVTNGGVRRTHSAPFGAQSHGTDDANYMSFAEWADRKAGRDSEDSYRD